MILLSVSGKHGTIRRYEVGGARPRLTHKYDHGITPCTFTRAVVDEFYRDPPPSSALDYRPPKIADFPAAS